MRYALLMLTVNSMVIRNVTETAENVEDTKFSLGTEPVFLKKLKNTISRKSHFLAEKYKKLLIRVAKSEEDKQHRLESPKRSLATVNLEFVQSLIREKRESRSKQLTA